MEKRSLNPKLSVGDRIELYHMDGESSMRPGMEGTVTSVERDVFTNVPDSYLVGVKWDNGRSISLCSDVDIWKLAKKKVNESAEMIKFFKSNEDLFKLFDWKFLREYLVKIQKSGIVNMLGSAPLLYCGSEHIDRYYGENKEDDESFQDVLEMADDAKQKMVQGTMKWLEDNNKEISVESANRYVRKLSEKIIELYVIFY